MCSQIYTKSERTEAKYTVRQAYMSAKARLEKIGLTQVCCNAIRNYDDNDKITLEQLNKLSQDMVDETIYHDDWKIKD